MLSALSPPPQSHGSNCPWFPAQAFVGIALVLWLALPGLLLAERGDRVMVNLDNAAVQPAPERLPTFSASDPAYADFINDYFHRHLSYTDDGVYWGQSVLPGGGEAMSKVEWDLWFSPWIDRGALGGRRPDNSIRDFPVSAILQTVVDKHGYTWGHRMWRDNKNQTTPNVSLYMWSHPKYQANSVCTKTGWDFNHGSINGWTGTDLTVQPSPVNSSLGATVTGNNPSLVSPLIQCDVLHMPVLELDIEYFAVAGQTTGADQRVDGLKVYWTTPQNPSFHPDRSITIDFSAAPPSQFPALYHPNLVSPSAARYPLYFPLYLHPEWGRSGRQIERIKIEPTGPGAQGTSLEVNYVRLNYDVRMTSTNAILITGAHQFVHWLGDSIQDTQGRDFLERAMPDLRRALLFLNEHLQGKTDHLLNLGWMVGHDGVGNQVGHGLTGNNWDLLPSGVYDIDSSMYYYRALLAMADLEEIAADRGISVPTVSVIGPDDQTPIFWNETPASLRALAAQVKTTIEEEFWNPVTRRFERNLDASLNPIHDLGSVHFNLQALGFGLGTQSQRDDILSWLDGRVIPGDTSSGSDLYTWRFGPRTNARHNTSYYKWTWLFNPIPPFGEQIQNGGAVPYTSFFDLLARTRTGDQAQIDKAYTRTREIEQWFRDVESAGGTGQDFYRAYYANAPGTPQGGGQAGGLGLDREATSKSSIGSTFLFHAFLGIEAKEHRVLDIAPKLPTALDWIGVSNVYFHRNHLTVEAGRTQDSVYVDLGGSSLPFAANLETRVTLRQIPTIFEVTVDGIPTQSYQHDPVAETVTVTVPLAASRIEVREVATASFDAQPTSGVVPLLTTFTDNSTGTITQRRWDFDGDGVWDATNPTAPISHTYTATGIYSVSLEIQGPWGTHVETRNNLITVTDPAPPGLDVDFSLGLQGWWTSGMTATQTSEGQRLTINTANGSQLHSPTPLGLDADSQGTLVLRLRVEGAPLTADASGRVYFKTVTEPFFFGHGVDLTIPAGTNRWRYVIVDMASHPDWQGDVTKLRIDPIYGHAGQIIHLASVQSFPAGYTPPYRVDFRQGLEGWNQFGLGLPVLTSDGVRMTLNNANPQFHSPVDLSVDGSQFQTLKVRMKVDTPNLAPNAFGKIFFKVGNITPQFSETRRFTFDVDQAGVWFTLTIDAGTNVHWLGPDPITKLRVDPLYNHVGSTVTISDVWIE